MSCQKTNAFLRAVSLCTVTADRVINLRPFRTAGIRESGPALEIAEWRATLASWCWSSGTCTFRTGKRRSRRSSRRCSCPTRCSTSCARATWWGKTSTTTFERERESMEKIKGMGTLCWKPLNVCKAVLSSARCC